MKIMQNRMDRGYFRYKEEFDAKAIRILESGWYILGKEVENFEKEFAKFVTAKYCVGVASGLDALYLAFRGLGIGEGDEVIVQANTYIASVMGITMNRATPVFVEPNEFYNIDAAEIEKKITSRTKAILIVHLYGQATDMGDVVYLCKKYNLKLVEDCAQSHGATYRGQMTGTFGDVGCFSFYPSKNLGAFGDAGAIVTNDARLAEQFKVYRNYGSEKRYYNKVIGVNSRLDEMQAGFLRVRLTHLQELNQERIRLAKTYSDKITNPAVVKPNICKDCSSVFHQYVIRIKMRDSLQEYLKSHDIGTIIHYPIPPHLSEAYSYLGLPRGSFPITEKLAETVLSLPMYNGMTPEEQMYVINNINNYQGEQA